MLSVYFLNCRSTHYLINLLKTLNNLYDVGIFSLIFFPVYFPTFRLFIYNHHVFKVDFADVESVTIHLCNLYHNDKYKQNVVRWSVIGKGEKRIEDK